LKKSLDSINNQKQEVSMPQGDKSKYTDKQKRQAQRIADSYKGRGVSKKTTKKQAWAAVNRTTGGGKKSAMGGPSSWQPDVAHAI
jgi:hypothetical protein